MLTSNLLNARSLPKLGAAVRSLRQRRGLTQSELARQSNVSREWIIALEAGKTYGMEIGRLMQVLDTLNANLMIQPFDNETADQ